jgi:transmembrane sensor
MERPEKKLVELGSAVRDALAVEAATSEEIRQARAGFLRHFAARSKADAGWRRRTGVSRWRILLLAGATAAGAVALWAWTTRPITFQVGASGAPGQTGDLVRGASEGLVPVRFSEGSSVILHEGTRLRVLATDARGARMLIEDGTVDASIASATIGKKHWSFEAGPFKVQVTGTRFTLTYRAHDQSFGLATHEGRVIVSGPCLSAPKPVVAGGRLDLACLAPPATAPRTASISLPPAAGPERAAPSGPSGKAARNAQSWRELLATGHLLDAVRAAERADFERVCQTASAKDLLALADAARLFARTARAVTALRILRQRFPASAEASIAAFALGRIAFEQKRAYPEAVDWFATYLREQPSGPLHGDCVGRLMEARLRAGDQVGAHSDAEHYLRRFPEGPYASEARGILAK